MSASVQFKKDSNLLYVQTCHNYGLSFSQDTYSIASLNRAWDRVSKLIDIERFAPAIDLSKKDIEPFEIVNTLHNVHKQLLESMRVLNMPVEIPKKTTVEDHIVQLHSSLVSRLASLNKAPFETVRSSSSDNCCCTEATVKGAFIPVLAGIVAYICCLIAKTLPLWTLGIPGGIIVLLIIIGCIYNKYSSSNYLKQANSPQGRIDSVFHRIHYFQSNNTDGKRGQRIHPILDSDRYKKFWEEIYSRPRDDYDSTW